MYIQELQLQNFRKFEDITLQFHPQFNILIGENASGKTTICDAIKRIIHVLIYHNGLMPFSAKLDNHSNDFRYSFPKELSQEHYFPLRITVSLSEFLESNSKWTFQKDHYTDHYTFQSDIDISIKELQKKIQSKISNGEKIVLPLFAYYGIPRTEKQQKNQFKNFSESRLNAYKTCLDGNCNTRPFFNWLYRQFLIELKTKQKNTIIGTVREAIKKAIPDCQEIEYDPVIDEVVVSLGEQTFSFNDLSDGYRSMLGMVADIAHRMARLNPDLEAEVLQQTPGIVVIDELDLHLHPKWQYSVVENLRSIFPKVQFIATTHSPFIIQSARDGEVINLDNIGTVLSSPGEYRKAAFPGPSERYDKKGIEEIAEEIQKVEVSYRSQRRQKMYEAAQEYYKILNEIPNASDEEKRTKKENLDNLLNPYMDNVAYAAFLKMERAAAGIDK
ncbi:MAG: AAA family ATPase [Planctomycetaceae bacterium]|jgi:predicted ATP-binding protein involved in virulence|nr:AAA family ATPase [Planctomycetaceae bacterium]